MGCWVSRNRVDKLVFILYWRGQRWQESSGEPYTSATRARGELFAAKVEESMRRGTFPHDYARLFRRGARLAQFAPPAPAPKTGLTLQAFSERFEHEKQSAAYRATYRRTITRHLDNWIRPAVGHLPLNAIEREHVVALRDRILADGKRSVKYARNIIGGTLSALFSEAVTQKLLTSSPTTGMKWGRQRRTKKQDPFTRPELERIIAHLAKKRSRYAFTYILALADTGMRPSEASGLDWGDIETNGDGSIQIRQSHVQGELAATKTEASDRTLIGLTPRLRAALHDLMPLRVEPDAPVFAGRTGRRLRQERIYERHWLPALRALSIRPRGL